GVSPLDYFFNSMETMVFEDLLHSGNYKKIKTDALPLQIVNDVIAHFDTVTAGYNGLIHTEFKENSIANYNPNEYRKMLQELNQLDSFKRLQTQLQRNTALNKRFFERFVQLVHNRAQNMINAYLTGDVGELEKRQYYYAGKRNYNEFLEYMQLALSLISADHPLANVLRINQLYLSGVIARLQLATSKKTDSLVKAAYQYQQQSLILEPYAAYIHNELGNLYIHQKKYDSAAYHFSFASTLAPSWAIPWSNKIRLNLIQKNWSKAKEAFQKADSLQPNLAYVLMNAGLVMEQEKNFLAAETWYLRSINENNVHYLPFERLANIYLHTGEYSLANEYFQKAAERKNQFAINDSYFNFGLELGGVPVGNDKIKRAIQNCENGLQENIPQWTEYYKALKGFSFITNNNTYSTDSLKIVQDVLMKVPDMPLVHHYLGLALWKTGRYDEAEPFLLQAAANYKSETVFKNDLTKILYSLAPKVTDSCLLNVFLYLMYDEAEDHYMLASIYEKRKEQEKLIKQYESVIAAENKKQFQQAALSGFEALIKTTDSSYDANEVLIEAYLKPVVLYGVLKLARLYEQWGNYEGAEKLLLKQIQQNRKAGEERRKAQNENLKARAEFRKTDIKNIPETGQIVFAGTDGYILAINELIEKEIYNFYLRMIQLFPRNYYWKEQAGLFLYNRLDLCYKQMPVEEYIDFTNRIPDFA
ncbi:MAG: tetratricopeptide repeat protein, partial [Lacibacter sp.]